MRARLPRWFKKPYSNHCPDAGRKRRYPSQELGSYASRGAAETEILEGLFENPVPGKQVAQKSLCGFSDRRLAIFSRDKPWLMLRICFTDCHVFHLSDCYRSGVNRVGRAVILRGERYAQFGHRSELTNGDHLHFLDSS